MQSSKEIYLLTGSNIEPRLSFLNKANRLIEIEVGPIVNKSSVYESAPWGFDAETPFLNQVLYVKTILSADEVLLRILMIEKELGRKRRGKEYISRKIDIDILYYEKDVIETEELIIPHPRMHMRKFTMLPLAEIAGGFIHPKFKKSNKDLLSICPDNSSVSMINKD